MINLSIQLNCFWNKFFDCIYKFLIFKHPMLCLIIRGHHLALIIHSVEFVSLVLRANLIIRSDRWVTAHLLLPWLICRLHPILWVPQLVLLPHHLLHQSCGLNLPQDPARSQFHPECLHQWAHLLDQLAWPCQLLDPFLNQALCNLLRVPVL